MRFENQARLSDIGAGARQRPARQKPSDDVYKVGMKEISTSILNSQKREWERKSEEKIPNTHTHTTPRARKTPK